MTRSSIFIVDAFADGPFTGNPAAVCLLDGVRSDDWLQSFAAEMNLSETAFILRNPGGYGLRWFTPTTEVRLCGHATLASAHVLWESDRLGHDEPATFQTRSGLLVAERHDGADGRGVGIQLDLPAIEMTQTEPPQELLQLIGVRAVAVAATADPTRHDRDWLLELGSEQEVLDASPDLIALRTVPAGVILTAPASRPDCDIVSRYFAPAWGIDEDPVTGAAHCALGPYWMGRFGLTSFRAFQASARGGRMTVGTEVPGRVQLRGNAVLISSGQLWI